ncbi:hypothetical protein LINPERHAP2_LOCUS35536 [Linum perenne]
MAPGSLQFKKMQSRVVENHSMPKRSSILNALIIPEVRSSSSTMATPSVMQLRSKGVPSTFHLNGAASSRIQTLLSARNDMREDIRETNKHVVTQKTTPYMSRSRNMLHSSSVPPTSVVAPQDVPPNPSTVVDDNVDENCQEETDAKSLAIATELGQIAATYVWPISKKKKEKEGILMEVLDKLEVKLDLGDIRETSAVDKIWEHFLRSVRTRRSRIKDEHFDPFSDNLTLAKQNKPNSLDQDTWDAMCDYWYQDDVKVC